MRMAGFDLCKFMCGKISQSTYLNATFHIHICWPRKISIKDIIFCAQVAHLCFMCTHLTMGLAISFVTLHSICLQIHSVILQRPNLWAWEHLLCGSGYGTWSPLPSPQEYPCSCLVTHCLGALQFGCNHLFFPFSDSFWVFVLFACSIDFCLCWYPKDAITLYKLFWVEV